MPPLFWPRCMQSTRTLYYHTLAVTLFFVGGVKETQEMMDFCGRHSIVCDIEKISAAQINVAYDRAVASDVKYRFVIDCATI